MGDYIRHIQDCWAQSAVRVVVGCRGVTVAGSLCCCPLLSVVVRCLSLPENLLIFCPFLGIFAAFLRCSSSISSIHLAPVVGRLTALSSDPN